MLLSAATNNGIRITGMWVYIMAYKYILLYSEVISGTSTNSSRN